MIIEVKNLDQPLVCCAVTSVWPSEGSPMADHLDWTWMTYQKSQKLRLAHKTSTYWFELLIRKVKNSDHKTSTYYLNCWSEMSKLGPAHKTSTHYLNCWSEMSKTRTSPLDFYVMTWITYQKGHQNLVHFKVSHLVPCLSVSSGLWLTMIGDLHETINKWSNNALAVAIVNI